MRLRESILDHNQESAKITQSPHLGQPTPPGSFSTQFSQDGHLTKRSLASPTCRHSASGPRSCSCGASSSEDESDSGTSGGIRTRRESHKSSPHGSGFGGSLESFASIPSSQSSHGSGFGDSLEAFASPVAAGAGFDLFNLLGDSFGGPVDSTGDVGDVFDPSCVLAFSPCCCCITAK